MPRASADFHTHPRTASRGVFQKDSPCGMGYSSSVLNW
jgi:hypothetical protein